MTSYFNLLIEQLKRRVDGPSSGPVDIMAFYNFTTFDIIGWVQFVSYFITIDVDRYSETLHWASLLVRSRVVSITNGSGNTPPEL